VPQKTFYMCPPTYFEIEYAINVWTNINDRVDHAQAMAEWELLNQTYQELGVHVETVPAAEGVVELTFIGDSIFLYNGKAISSRFRCVERANEVPVSASFFAGAGFEVCQLPEGVHYEGNGDSLIWNGIMLGGHGIRSDREAYGVIAELLNVEVIPLELVQPFYHLDLALCPINKDTVIYYPGAFTPAAQETIRKMAKRAVAAERDEVMKFALNGKVIGDCIVLNGNPCPDFRHEVQNLGLRIITVNTNEFNKAGGAAKCLTLEHYLP